MDRKPINVNQKMSLMHNYYKWVIDDTKKYIGDYVIDSGCGIGNLIPLLQDRRKVVCFDYDLESVEYLKKNYNHLDNFSFFRVDLTQDDVFNLNLGEVDTIISLDVVEHIENDLEVVKKYYRLLKKGGHLVIKVPAHMFLYCEIDKDGGHFKRYNKSDWRKIAKEIGFEIVELKYMNMLGFFTYWWTGKIKKPNAAFSQSVGDRKMKFINSILPFYSFCERFIYKPVGLSVLTVLKK